MGNPSLGADHPAFAQRQGPHRDMMINAQDRFPQPTYLCEEKLKRKTSREVIQDKGIENERTEQVGSVGSVRTGVCGGDG